MNDRRKKPIPSIFLFLFSDARKLCITAKILAVAFSLIAMQHYRDSKMNVDVSFQHITVQSIKVNRCKKWINVNYIIKATNEYEKKMCRFATQKQLRDRNNHLAFCQELDIAAAKITRSAKELEPPFKKPCQDTNELIADNSGEKATEEFNSHSEFSATK